VMPWHCDVETSTATHYTLWCNTASIMKVLVWKGHYSQQIK